MAFLFSINYPKCKVSNSISLQLLLTTSYPVRYLGAGSSFQKKSARAILFANLLSSSHSHLDWNGLYLMLEDYWEGKVWTPTSHSALPVIGCELHPVWAKDMLREWEFPNHTQFIACHFMGVQNVWMTQREDAMVVKVSFCTLQKMAVTFARISFVQCFGVGICSSKQSLGFSFGTLSLVLWFQIYLSSMLSGSQYTCSRTMSVR